MEVRSEVRSTTGPFGELVLTFKMCRIGVDLEFNDGHSWARKSFLAARPALNESRLIGRRRSSFRMAASARPIVVPEKVGFLIATWCSFWQDRGTPNARDSTSVIPASHPKGSGGQSEK